MTMPAANETERQYATTANTTANSRQQQTVKLTRRNNRDTDSVSIDSAKSTRSTSSLFSRLLGRGKHRNADDEQSVSSAFSSYSWWTKRKDKKNKKEDKPAKRKKFRTFRWRKKGKKKGRSTNDQLVADFFDVQSIASEPDFVGTNKLKSATLVDKGQQLETQSVVSRRSQRSTGFTGFLFRKRLNLHDEVEGIEDNVIIQTNNQDFDEEITLGSGFENMSLAESIEEESVDATTSLDRKPEAAPENESFLQRILQKRTQKKQNSHLLQAIRVSSPQSDLPDTALPTLGQQAPQPCRRQSLDTRDNSTKSLGALPVNREAISVQGKAGDTKKSTPNQTLNRWDSDQSLDAPKPPQRQPEKDPAMGPDSLRPSQVTSQSMRNLATKPLTADEAQGRDDEEDFEDDDSVLSLLSGLLATWSSERETAESEALSLRHHMVRSNEEQPKSILKTSKNLVEIHEETKEERRPRYSVEFDKIEIREYERVVGDNPSCSKGPPVSIGWAYMEATKYAVNDYENLIKPPRRSKKEFHLAPDTRTQLLTKEWECSQEDIQKARREATYIQYCRAKTSFSGSRAAAKEAAFLRKAAQKQAPSNPKKQFAMAPQALHETSPKPAVRAPEVPVSGLEPESHIPLKEFAPAPLAGPRCPKPPPSALRLEQRKAAPLPQAQLKMPPPEQAPAPKKVPGLKPPPSHSLPEVAPFEI